ncbi:Hsp70 family protein [Corynebacterium epidermidicanis]|uniref:Chaperone protein HscA n=1 Tax=Corynebacterium epidermidicanis TaxID=1050174 RepID=A0A0G3GTI3_9CORY|nr:Hsp70 family protein [Corynebacterium epidermidicanis]AKK03860.1 Chaperone protein HscA [Corynebacterium epidermidicanis]
MNDAWHFGIDFGTSNTSAAHTAPLSGAVETVSLTHRSNLMPSAVYREDGEIFAGDTALLRGRRSPAQLLLSPKRYIDHDTVQLGGQDADLLELISAVIGAALERAKAQHAGTDPETVTLTHPEAWSVHSVGQLVAATKRAGVAEEKIRTISEPRAAAVHYAAQQHVEPGKHVAVFDFGGGTLDIAVLQSQPDGNFRVVSAKGDNSLGGRTVDNLMFRWLITQLEHDDPDFADYVRNAPISVMHSLEENVREAKEILSDASSATVSISTPQGEQDILITREEFNSLIDPSVERAVELTRAALSQAGVSSSDTPLYLTGGSSRIPHVHNRLSELGQVQTLDDPKTVVSRGAVRATLHGFTEGTDGQVRQPIAPTAVPSSPAATPQTNAFATPPQGSTPGNPAGPSSPFGTPPSSHQSSTSSVGASAVNFTPTEKPGGGKMKLILAGIAAVVVLGAGAMIIPNMMGGNSQPKFQISPQLQDTHLARLDGQVVDYMPAAFLEKVKSCSEDEEAFKSYEYKFAQGTKTRTCYLATLTDAPKDNSFYKGNVNILKGDEAKNLQKKFDEMPDTSKVVLQKAKGNQPAVYSVVNDKETYIQVYYEKQGTMISKGEYGSMPPGEFEEWAKYFGFLEK